MDKAEATLVVGLLAGFIGLFSAVLSHLSLRYQLRKQAEEAERVREHNIKSQAVVKKLQSLEELWLLLVQIEVSCEIADETKDKYIMATLWLPENVRVEALSVLNTPSSDSERKTKVAKIRHYIIQLTDTYI